MVGSLVLVVDKKAGERQRARQDWPLAEGKRSEESNGVAVHAVFDVRLPLPLPLLLAPPHGISPGDVSGHRRPGKGQEVPPGRLPPFLLP